MKTIETQTYQDLADKLIATIGDREFFNGRVEHEGCLLTVVVIVYRNERQMTDIVPVWWEFIYLGSPNPLATDFSWLELKKYLPNNV